MEVLRHLLASARHDKMTKPMNLIDGATHHLTLETSQSPTHHQVEPNKDGEEEMMKAP